MRSQVHLDAFLLPGPASNLPGNCGTVASQLGRNHRLGVTRIEKFLNLGSVGHNQIPVF